MSDEHLIVLKFIGALLGGYLLGSAPFALLAARSHGVDIFSTGSNMAGTANVFWHVGRGSGAMVFTADAAKGAAAVLIAGLLDLPAAAILLVAGAAVLGHWKSIFAGFRGGDGMATLIGVTITLEPALSVAGIIVGLATVLAMRRSPLRSSLALLAGFTIMLGASQYYRIDRDMVVGLAALAALVLFHTVVARRRRLRWAAEGRPWIRLDLDQPSGLGAPTAENR